MVKTQQSISIVQHDSMEQQRHPGVAAFPTVSKIRDILKLVSSVLIPLLIGIATVILAIVQQEIAQENRKNDLIIANERRIQDLYVANETRNTEQRIAEEQRAQELILSEARRTQDRELNADIQREAVLVDYFRKMIDLYLSNNLSFTLEIRHSLIIRVKTLIALRRLDSVRKELLFQFLFESHLIAIDENPINLVGADLDGLILLSKHHMSFHKLALAATSLVNASFHGANISFSDFRAANLTGADFSQADITSSNFHQAILRHANFTNSNHHGLMLSNADLTGAIGLCSDYIEKSVTHTNTIIHNGNRLTYRKNVVKNGNAYNCSLVDWEIDPPDSIQIIHQTSKTGSGSCAFSTTTTSVKDKQKNAIMSQKIGFSLYTDFLRFNQAYLYIFVAIAASSNESFKAYATVRFYDSSQRQIKYGMNRTNLCYTHLYLF
jgi:uncharacterized protein YjbI with pentapeptide repeats